MPAKVKSTHTPPTFFKRLETTFWKGFFFCTVRGPVKAHLVNRLKKALIEIQKERPKQATVTKGTSLLNKKVTLLTPSRKIAHIAAKLERYSAPKGTTTFKHKKNIQDHDKWRAKHPASIFVKHPRFIDIVHANHIIAKMNLFNHEISSCEKVLVEGKMTPIEEAVKRLKVDPTGKFLVEEVEEAVTLNDRSVQKMPVKKGWNYTFDKGFTYQRLTPKTWTPLMRLSVEEAKKKFQMDMGDKDYGAQLLSAAKGKDASATPGYLVHYGHVWMRLFQKNKAGEVEVYSLGFYVGKDFELLQAFKTFHGEVQQDDRYEFLPKSLVHTLPNCYTFTKEEFDKAYTLGQGYLFCGLHYQIFDQNCITMVDTIFEEVEKVNGNTFKRPKGYTNPKETYPKPIRKFIDFWPEWVITIPRYLYKTGYQILFVLFGMWRGLKVRNEDTRTQKKTPFFTIEAPIPLKSFKLFTYNVMKKAIPRFWRVEQYRNR